VKIYIAEDDDILRQMLKEFLIDEGYEVKDFSNGFDLVEYSLKEKPDLIITDIQMPQMQGDSMIAMIEAYPELAPIPVIVISGMPDKELKILGIPLEVPIMSKPFDFEKLKQAIEKYKK